MSRFPGDVLLLPPIVGHLLNEEAHRGYVPPRAQYLMELPDTGLFPTPRRVGIHVGSVDWQSRPREVEAFGRAAGISVNVVPGLGHMQGRGTSVHCPIDGLPHIQRVSVAVFVLSDDSLLEAAPAVTQNGTLYKAGSSDHPFLGLAPQR